MTAVKAITMTKTAWTTRMVQLVEPFAMATSTAAKFASSGTIRTIASTFTSQVHLKDISAGSGLTFAVKKFLRCSKGCAMVACNDKHPTSR